MRHTHRDFNVIRTPWHLQAQPQPPEFCEDAVYRELLSTNRSPQPSSVDGAVLPPGFQLYGTCSEQRSRCHVECKV